MIKNSRNQLYVGISENSEKRVVFHNSKQGAKFTASTALGTGKPNFKIVFLEPHSTLIEVRQREIQIKKWRREKKEILIEKYQKGLSTKS